MERLNDLLEFGDGNAGGGEAVVSAKDRMAFRVLRIFGVLLQFTASRAAGR
jgi:hypothetical protein